MADEVVPRSGHAPRVSVIMPFLNEGRFIAEAIESVLGQTFTEWELLTIDDGSTDDGPESRAATHGSIQIASITCGTSTEKIAEPARHETWVSLGRRVSS